MLPENKTAFVASAKRLLELVDGRSRSGYASTIARAVLNDVIHTQYPDLRALRFEEGSLGRHRQTAVGDFVAWLEGRPALEAAYWISTLYAYLLPPGDRASQALFFTPPKLSSRLIESLRGRGVAFAHAKVTDPTCGGGAFLAPVAIQMARELDDMGWSSRRIITHVARNLVGFDVNPLLCRLSGVFLNMALYNHVRDARLLLDSRIVVGDALAVAPAEGDRFDVVLSNPPYRKLTADEFARLSAPYRDLAIGQPNLYALFIDLSLRLCKRGGHIGLLTPAGFFGGRSFGPLRKRIRQEADVRQVDFIDRRDGAFLDVEQETAITVLRKDKGPRSAVAVSVTADAKEFESLGLHTLPEGLTAPWALPRNRKDTGAIPAFGGAGWNLESYGYAPRTGFLVPHRMPVPRLKTKGNRLWACPLIWATQIGHDGVHRFAPGRKAHADIYVDVSSHGAEGVLTTPSVAIQRTSSKDQGRRVRCAPITEAFVAEHQGYMGENHVCFVVPILGRPQLVSVELLSAILNSGPVDEAFRCLSGTATVSAYELRALPLPDPKAVQRALAGGASIHEAARLGYTDPIAAGRKAA